MNETMRLFDESDLQNEERNHRFQLEAEKQKIEAEERKERLRLEAENYGSRKKPVRSN